MAFNIIKNQEPYYNNAGFYENTKDYEGDDDCVCYRYKRFNKQLVAVLNPKIDTLRFTLDTKDNELRKIIHDKMVGLGKMWEPTEEHFGEAKYGTYEIRRYVKGFPKDVVLFATKLNNFTNNFLQVGLHAADFKAQDIKKLFDLLSDLSNGHWASKFIYENSGIIRMDWCVDFNHISPHEIGMWKTSGTRGAKHFIHRGLGTTGMELNAKHPEKGNKNKKGKHNASKAYYYNKGHQSKSKGEDTTRFEFRTFKEGTSIKDNIISAGKKGVFKPYDVLDFANTKPVGFEDHEWLSFGDACKMRTRDQAVSMLPVHKQENAVASISKIGDKVWQVEKLKAAMTRETERFKFF